MFTIPKTLPSMTLKICKTIISKNISAREDLKEFLSLTCFSSPPVFLSSFSHKRVKYIFFYFFIVIIMRWALYHLYERKRREKQTLLLSYTIKSYHHLYNGKFHFYVGKSRHEGTESESRWVDIKDKRVSYYNTL